ncbi:MAG: tRNA (guanosine(46)-N7)-methyltransferase TrmB [Lawsonibacter sp.]|jgi:tRNA (guanine-N7-)-methyltransferase
MRMRKKPNLGARMERCSQYLIDNPQQYRGSWKELKPDASCLYLELGCGKGRFTCETAEQNPDVLYIAIERVPDAMVIAMERCMEKGLSNVFFIDGDASMLRSYFAPEEVDRLYINFCDPWPSHKHARRRLTHENFLVLYRGILRENGEIHFKTDNRDLFEYSLFQFPKAGYVLSEISRNLHEHGVQGVMTDYEEKFYNLGTPINRCVGTKQTMNPEPEFHPIAGPKPEHKEKEIEIE